MAIIDAMETPRNKGTGYPGIVRPKSYSKSTWFLTLHWKADKTPVSAS